MHSHIREVHPELDTPEDTKALAKIFEVKVVRGHRTALSRQVHEAVTIRKAQGTVLNSKEEYSRCTIPTLGLTTTPSTTTPAYTVTPTTGIEETQTQINKRSRERDQSRDRVRAKRPRRDTTPRGPAPQVPGAGVFKHPGIQKVCHPT